ncbi:MAG: hypothetical protein ACOWWR_05840 [Eubacteriales bacterium]
MTFRERIESLNLQLIFSNISGSIDNNNNIELDQSLLFFGRN